MTGAKMKLMVDQQGVTIAGNNFRLTTGGTAPRSGTLEPDDVMFGVAESVEMETILSDLEAMTRRTYGQFCGLSRALEVIGERWALLIVRDLLVSPKHVVDLQVGLPRIPADVLASRLRELERAGVVQRVIEDVPGDAVRYELTEYGLGLDETVLSMGRWGARLLGEPRPDEIVTPDSLIMAMRATFQRDAAKGVHASYELRVGHIVLNLRVDDGRLTTSAGPLPGADLTLEPGMALKDLMSGEISADEAIERGLVSVQGERVLLNLFTQLFRIPGGDLFR
jgi:DNA-binding HxlR family transcriptional regulator